MTARGRADAFARALDDGTAGPVVAAVMTVRDELADRTAPSPEVQARMRQRVLAVAHAQYGSVPVAPSGRTLRAQRWLRPVTTAFACLLLVVAALVGVSYASRNSLPGDTLYGAKRTTEALQVRTTRGSLDQGVARLHLAEKRLAEVRQLAGEDAGQALGAGSGGDTLASGSSAALIRSTLATMDDETRVGSGQVLQVARTTGSQDPLSLLAAWSTGQTARLEALGQVVPAAAQDRLAASLTLIRGVRNEASTPPPK